MKLIMHNHCKPIMVGKEELSNTDNWQIKPTNRKRNQNYA